MSAILSIALPAAAQEAPDPLSGAFEEPPPSARPRVWWHWMNGNVTEEGIRKDIDWMARIGIGGLHNFDAALETPQMVEKRLAYMTPAWKRAFRLAAELADQKGMELAVASSAGWSETGGPWVPPADGMKKLVWSETVVRGGARVATLLPRPPGNTGTFQDMQPMKHVTATQPATPIPDFYADARILAYPVTDGSPMPPPRITSNAPPPIDAALLVDGRYGASIDLPRGTDAAPAFLAFAYPALQTIRAVSVALDSRGRVYRPSDVAPALQASDDGATWRTVAELPMLTGVPTTVSFAPVTARHFRMIFPTRLVDDLRVTIGHAPGAVKHLVDTTPLPVIPIRELTLHREPRIDRFEAKAGFVLVDDYYALDRALASEGAIAPGSVIDLTDRMAPDGRLEWTPPPGDWRVIRLGYSLTGTLNHPATREATGLEIDKYDGAAVRRYIDHYLGTYADTTGPGLIGSRGLQAMLTDSIEAGPANWTGDMIARFKALRGYDPVPWLPTLTGVLVGSREASEKFLYDYRRTLSDLVSSQHYKVIADAAQGRGLTLYGEAFEVDRPFFGDDIAMRRYADIPMAALWTWQPERGVRTTLLADMKGASSAAHLYGRPIVAAESLTSANAPWAFAPADLKPVVDLQFAYGINRTVIHTSVHQPVDDRQPGLSLALFGQYFNRHETWAEMAKPWIDYIARSNFLLQQGRNVADVAYFYGEEAPLTGLYNQRPVSDAPRRFAYDFVNADALLDDLTVEAGEIVSRGGARYRLLYLGGSSRRMTLPVLRRIEAMVRAGATVVGPKPEASPSLADDPTVFATLATQLWSDGDIGAGKVIASNDIEAALAALDVAPDFAHSGTAEDGDILFVHRRLDDGDLYFLSNRGNQPRRVEARFRIAGKAPEIWRADGGAPEAASYAISQGITSIPLDLLPNDAFFVMFRQPATATRHTVARMALRELATLSGAWNVAFQPDRGAPPSVDLPALAPLDTHSDPGIRHFSGTATYRRTLTLPAAAWGKTLWLDLGRVGDVAEVRLNGQLAGTAWKAPYRVDISGLACAGSNELEVRVANLWVNRLVGDARSPDKKVAFTTLPTYHADAPLRPSGLIGPVTILVQEPAR
ncbi:MULTISPECIES: glycosyl hydrolase [unclassified Sphingopyxis]|uniref:glycosyl hydrolase n=1 Tax=unclassified Sphingopyxis TaxID=2614943 RepID=UPI001E4DB6E1|nr:MULTISPECIES: glycosyl hydrolase [unclassified Sphingopyxis]